MSDTFKWDIATSCLTEYDADGFLGIQVDVDGGNEGGAPSFEAHFPTGFYSRPRDPEVGDDGLPITGINVLYAWEGNTGHAFPLGDPAVIQRLPKLSKGSTIIYAQTDDGQLAYVRLSGKGTGSLVAYVPGPGVGLYIRLDAENGLDISLPWGRFTFGPNGFHVRHASGARIDLGGVGGLPGPLSAFGSYATMKAAMVSLQGAATSVGADNGLANGLAVQALQTFITALVTAISSITTATPGASAMAPIEASLPALFVALNALGKVV